MPISNKLIAAAASAIVLAGGGTAVGLNASQTSAASVPVTTPTAAQTHTVRVNANGTTTDVQVADLSVASALLAAGVTPDASVRVSPDLGSQLAEGDTVTVSAVRQTTWTRAVSLSFATTKVNDPTLEKGQTKVKTTGVAGEKVETLVTTSVGGSVESIEVTSEQVTREPVTEVVLVGTKAPVQATSRSSDRTTTATSGTTTSSDTSSSTSSSGAGLDLSREAMWDRIAKCESSGNWSINTGNGYYGGLQFSLATWRSVGGTDFAAYPHQASRAEQITVANRLYAKRGLQPWGCRHAA